MTGTADHPETAAAPNRDPADAVSRKRAAHAKAAKKSRERAKAGLVSIRVTVPRTAADALHDRGFLQEWNLENVKALGDACSEFLLETFKNEIA